MTHICQTTERDATLADNGPEAMAPECIEPAFRATVAANSSEQSAHSTAAAPITDSVANVLEDVAAAQEAMSRTVDLAALLNRCLGNIGLVERVMTKFRETGGADLNHLELALETSDLQKVVEIAHRFKGAASNISASKLQELAAQAEHLGQELNSAELKEVLKRLRFEWRKFVNYSETFLSTAAHAPCPVKNPL